MKYLVKNKTTREEILCEKVVSCGEDYYLSNDDFNYPCFVVTDIDKLVEVNENNDEYYHRFNSKKVIATTNPSLGLPMVIDEVESITEELCTKKGLENNTIDLNAYAGGVIDGFIETKETYQYTKDDMVEWFNWCENYKRELNKWTLNNIKGAELFTPDQLFSEWQEQRTLTITVR